MNITTQTQALMRICPPQHQSPQLVTQEAFVSVRPGVAAAAADVKRQHLPLDGSPRLCVLFKGTQQVSAGLSIRSDQPPSITPTQSLPDTFWSKAVCVDVSIAGVRDMLGMCNVRFTVTCRGFDSRTCVNTLLHALLSYDASPGDQPWQSAWSQRTGLQIQSCKSNSLFAESNLVFFLCSEKGEVWMC